MKLNDGCDVIVQEEDFVARDDFEDADQLRIGNDGIFMLTFFSKDICGGSNACNAYIYRGQVHPRKPAVTYSNVCSGMIVKLFKHLYIFSFTRTPGLDVFFCFPPSVAFLFNWIGFFLSFCLTTSAAGRYGAISGFGLSLIKWVLIVRVGHFSFTVVSDPAVRPNISRTSSAPCRNTPCFLFRYSFTRVNEVAGRHGVHLKPVQAPFYS